MAKYNTDEEFLSKFAKKASISLSQAKEYSKHFVDSLNECLIINRAINIRKLGTFRLTARKSSLVRNPRTGEEYRLPLMYMIRFNASYSLKANANAKIKDQIKKARQ